ncbi:hypothetical protein COLO4_27160 [Corchorus olitorius]|uniref:Uncharacterized protein n=1 Tax=Corchorus olitorius TaxID=93759 RepID=A0A1R3HSY7_9ROSI|nr:hypothetical protein COLO4_27160 [Corchorus olitorius]
MADALLSAVATTILENINSRWIQEFGISGGLKTELERLQSTLSTIQAVLLDAEEKQWKSEAIKNWLRKLKDTAYDVDDILDEFATNTHRGRLQRDVRTLVSTSFSYPKQLLFRSKIAHKLKNLREKLDAIAGERSKFHLREGIEVLEDREVSDRGRRETSTSLVNKLETLSLSCCNELHTLPKGMKQLKNLIYLEIEHCDALASMPVGLGQLSSLRILSMFIVGKDCGCFIDELNCLALEGELCIKGLDNIKSSTDARSADLILKQNLRSLSLSWCENNDGELLENAEEVLSGLQPHLNLKKLSIRNYHGPRFSYWLMDLLVPNLVEILLENCGRCECLPPLGKLGFLKFLTVSGMDALKSIDSSFYGNGEISFPSLEHLSFSRMLSLEEWTTVSGKETFPLLTSLTIAFCPKLVQLPVLFQSLKILEVRNLMNLKSLSDTLDNLSVLKRLDLEGCSELQSLPAGLESLSCLESLDLRRCDSLIRLPENGLRGLSSLSSLWIQNCKKLESLSNGVRAGDWAKGLSRSAVADEFTMMWTVSSVCNASKLCYVLVKLSNTLIS